MSKHKRLIIGFAFITILNPVAYANDTQCNAPPYGSTEIEFKAFVKNFGIFVEPADLLQKVCRAKYSGTNRETFYNLGFTDHEIDEKSTADLAVDLIVRTKEFLDKE